MRCFIALCLSLLFASSLDSSLMGQRLNVRDAENNLGWHVFKIGAGGAIRGMDIQCDQGVGQCKGSGTTTKVVRTDTYGAYWFNPNAANCGNTAATGCWQQIVTSASIPGLSTPAAPSLSFSAIGVYDIVIAPSNTQVFYMIWNGYVWRSANQGASWTNMGLAQDTSANPNTGSASYSHRLAVDPANANVVIACLPRNGCSYTTNASAGTPTWTSISSSSIASANSSYGYLVAFDPSTTSGGNTSGVYICSYSNGIYHSSDYSRGGWSKLDSNGMPTTCVNEVIDASGNVWLVNDTYGSGGEGLGGLNKYANSTWSNPISSRAFLTSVAVNPNAPTHIYASNNEGQLYVSSDAGTTFGSASRLNNVRATDIPWLQVQQRRASNAIFDSMILFDPAQSNVIYAASGLGVWYANPPTSESVSSITWNSQSAAIEQLVANWIVSPNMNGAPPVMAVQDQGIFINSASLTAYPSNNPAGGAVANHSAWGVDWCSSSPSTIVALVTQSGVDNSGTYSGGTYTAFNDAPTSNGVGAPGGSIACLSASDICAVGVAGARSNAIVCTTNGGSSWSAASYSGTAPNVGAGVCDGWGGSAFYYEHVLIADRGNGNYYAYNAGNGQGTPPCVLGAAGLWRSTDHGATWTKVVSGQLDSGFTNNLQTRSVPGRSGNFYIATGVQGRSVAPSYFHLYECTDTGSVSCSKVSHVEEPWSIGFGAAAPGKSYPTIYLVGWVSLDGGVTYNFGIYQSDDHHVTWKRIGVFPNGDFDQVTAIEGDNSVYNRAYIGFGGSGFAQYNFLLNRDIDPAANDTGPAYLNRAA